MVAVDASTLESGIGVHSQRRGTLRCSQSILELVLPPLDCRTVLLKLPEARELCQITEQWVGLVRVKSVLRARLVLLILFAREPGDEQLRSFWSSCVGKYGAGLRPSYVLIVGCATSPP